MGQPGPLTEGPLLACGLFRLGSLRFEDEKFGEGAAAGYPQ